MLMFRKIQHIHLVGIGGSGMSGIAEVLLTLGYTVTGSDLQYSEAVRRLEECGGKIFLGHASEHIGGAQVVVTSSAVSPRNPEVLAAKSRKIPVIPRAEMLAELMRLKYGIAIAGAHGKTTTTSMVASVLAEAGLDPTFVVGGKVTALGSNARLGKGEFLIAEADESDGSFLHLSPSMAVVTNIDREHLDHYGSMERLEESFLQFINRVPFYGVAILCGTDPRIQAMLAKIVKRYVTYGIAERPDQRLDVQATDVRPAEGGSVFQVWFREQSLGVFRLGIPGRHNVANALATIAVGMELEVPIEVIRAALAMFGGVERRLQVRGERAGVTVVDDYGHHPTEIRATLEAVKERWDRRLVVLFQPHRYTRTRDLFDQFVGAFDHAQLLFLTTIYPAGEPEIPGVTAQALASAIRQGGRLPVECVERKETLVDRVLGALRPEDIVLTLGAGDIWKVGVDLLDRLDRDRSFS